MAIIKGPFRLHWQNLAHNEVWERLYDEVTDVLVGLVGPDAQQRWQDITRARTGLHNLVNGKMGRLWQHGRAWLYIYRSTVDREEGNESIGTIGAEWSLGRRQHSLGGSVYLDGEEREVTASVRVPRAGFYLTVPLPRAVQVPQARYGYQRELGVTYHDGALWFKLWNDPHESGGFPWDDARSRWRQPVLHLDNLLLGKQRYRSEDLETMTGTLQLDEGYEVQCRRFVAEWKRERWPVPTRLIRVEIKVPAGVPIPGKGESGWDCEDDAIYGVTMPAATIEEAAQKFIADVQQTRRKRGGRDWKLQHTS